MPAWMHVHKIKTRCVYASLQVNARHPEGEALVNRALTRLTCKAFWGVIKIAHLYVPGVKPQPDILVCKQCRQLAGLYSRHPLICQSGRVFLDLNFDKVCICDPEFAMGERLGSSMPMKLAHWIVLLSLL